MKVLECMNKRLMIAIIVVIVMSVVFRVSSSDRPNLAPRIKQIEKTIPLEELTLSASIENEAIKNAFVGNKLVSLKSRSENVENKEIINKFSANADVNG